MTVEVRRSHTPWLQVSFETYPVITTAYMFCLCRLFPLALAVPIIGVDLTC